MLLFDLTPDLVPSEGLISHLENSNTWIDLKFNKLLPEAIMCVLYLECDNSVLLDFCVTSRPSSKRKMEKCSNTVYTARPTLIHSCPPPDFLHHSIARTCTVIVNADSHTEGRSHWLTVHFRPKYSSAYYFDSYDIIPILSDIHAFIKRNCTTWDYNRGQLQGLTSNV